MDERVQPLPRRLPWVNLDHFAVALAQRTLAPQLPLDDLRGAAHTTLRITGSRFVLDPLRHHAPHCSHWNSGNSLTAVYVGSGDSFKAAAPHRTQRMSESA